MNYHEKGACYRGTGVPGEFDSIVIAVSKATIPSTQQICQWIIESHSFGLRKYTAHVATYLWIQVGAAAQHIERSSLPLLACFCSFSTEENKQLWQNCHGLAVESSP